MLAQRKIIKIEPVTLDPATFSPTCLTLIENGDTTYSLYRVSCPRIALHDYIASSKHANNMFTEDGSIKDCDQYFITEYIDKRGELLDIEYAIEQYPLSEILNPFILAKERDKKIESILHEQ